MNKKIIMLIIGILLILAGLIGWYCFNKDNNLDEQVLEDVKLNKETVVETDTVKEDSVSDERKTEIIKPKVPSKSEPPRPQSKVIINLPEPEIKVTPMFEEAVSEDKELTNPYVDSDGSIVVTDEIRQPVKQKVKFRGVVYNIKTKLAAPKN